MKRLIRPALWLVVAGLCLAAFVAAGDWSSTPIRWSDLSGWRDNVRADEAMVELVRLSGIALAGYVVVLSTLALLAEMAGLAQLVSLSRWVARVGLRSSIPMLRTRLWRTASTVAMSATTIAVSTSGLAIAGPTGTSPELVVDQPTAAGASVVLPAGFQGEVFGFGADPVAVIPDGLDAPPEVSSIERIVAAGDTLWKLCDDVYGHVDGDVIAQIAQWNALTDPSLIFPGQVIAFPALTSTPAGVPQPNPSVPDGAATWAVHEIVAGDTLWDILDHHYGHATADLVWQVADVNGIEDPSSIPIGTIVTLPTLEAMAAADPLGTDAQPDVAIAEPAVGVDAPTPEPAGPSVVTGASSSTGAEQGDAPWPPPLAATPTPPPAVVGAPAPVTTVAMPPSTQVRTAADDASATDEFERVALADDDSDLFDLAPRTLWWTVPFGLLLGGGIVAMLRRLRERRADDIEAGTVLPVGPPVAPGTELAVRTRTDHRQLATLQALLRTLTPHARELGDAPPVRAVEVSSDRVEVLFATPAPPPPAGWVTVDGGHSWTHRLLGDIEAPVRQLLTTGLVTLGLRDGGGDVLLDLETAGSLALTGDRAATLGLARSMVLELATYPLGVPMDVGLIGLDVDGTESCDRVWSNTTLARAVRVARETLDRLADTGATSVASARATTDDDTGTLDPNVFVVDVDNLSDEERLLLDELIALCRPHTGAAVIVIGEHPAATEAVRLDDIHNAVWAGARLTPPQITREAAAQVAVLFDHVEHAEAVPVPVSSVVAAAVKTVEHRVTVRSPDPAGWDATEPTLWMTEAAEFGEPSIYEPPPYEVLVQCMGEVTIHGRDITQASEVELLTLLTCMRDERPNIDTIYTLLTPDPFTHRGTRPPADPLRPMQQRISRLRAKLGVGPDGHDLLPSARTGRNSPSRYTISPLVITDVELLEHRYRASLELSSNEAYEILLDGLPLLSGPFARAKRGYDWFTTEGIASRCTSLVELYTARGTDLAAGRGDAVASSFAHARRRVVGDLGADSES